MPVGGSAIGYSSLIERRDASKYIIYCLITAYYTPIRSLRSPAVYLLQHRDLPMKKKKRELQWLLTPKNPFRSILVKQLDGGIIY
jgi:hypothetical protein